MSATFAAPTATAALALEDLEVVYTVRGIDRVVLRGVSFSIAPGEAYGLVGESGCGKSTTAYAALRYLPRNGKIVGGHVKVAGDDVTGEDPGLGGLGVDLDGHNPDPGRPGVRVGLPRVPIDADRPDIVTGLKEVHDPTGFIVTDRERRLGRVISRVGHRHDLTLARNHGSPGRASGDVRVEFHRVVHR